MSGGFDKSWRDYTGPVKTTADNKSATVETLTKPIFTWATLRDEKKRGKYGAVAHCVLPDLRILPADECGAVSGAIRFASKREGERFVFLMLEREAGRISDLLLQKSFQLLVTNPHGVAVSIGSWVCDFEYVRNGAVVVEDCKGFRNQLYIWKKRHVERQYGITILES